MLKRLYGLNKGELQGIVYFNYILYLLLTMKIMKLAGTVECTEQEVQKWYEEGRYLVTYNGVHQIFYSQAQQTYYTHPIIYKNGMVCRGRFFAMKAEHVNKLLGGNYVL